MALQPFTKHTYQFAAEPVHSNNLNEIQDAIVDLQENWADPEVMGSLADDISDEYSSSSTYKIGELCIRNNKLYRCTTPITTPEAWNTSHWAETTIANEIENRCLFFKDVPVSATTGTILSKSDSRITEDHIVTQCVWANSSAITARASWTTSAGSLVITGTCTSATTADITLVKKNN